jgi:hypothetical protein
MRLRMPDRCVVDPTQKIKIALLRSKNGVSVSVWVVQATFFSGREITTAL